MSTLLTKAGAVLGAATLASGSLAGIAALAPDAAFAEQAPAETIRIAEAAETAAPEALPAIPVQGDFSFTQDATMDNKTIAHVFNKAAATLCTSLPLYEVDEANSGIAISGPEGYASIDLANDDTLGTQARILGCACATNMPGGGAVMNAEVSGVTLESVFAMVKALAAA